ncbi:MAG: DUF1028 domain-containing protein [Rhodospirillaceae bacterium]|nr:DUF1028 domain-containing protein [Rhodospirillaceae bacterium]
MTFELGLPSHTLTVIGRCAETGYLGVAISTSPPAVGARCPLVRTGLAAVSSQAYANPQLSRVALDLLERGYAPEKALDEIRASDEWAEYRQVGIVDREGRSAAYTGERNTDWKGHIAGANFVAMGNYLHGAAAVEATAETFRKSRGEIIEERLLRALEAGRDRGGDLDGHASSALVVHGRDDYPRTDLRVDLFAASESRAEQDAVDELRRIFTVYRPLIPYYEQRPRNPNIGSWREWLQEQGF